MTLFEICKCDVYNETLGKKLADDFREKFGNVDVMVNKAGVDDYKKQENITLHDYNKVISMNLTYTFITT